MNSPDFFWFWRNRCCSSCCQLHTVSSFTPVKVIKRAQPLFHRRMISEKRSSRILTRNRECPDLVAEYADALTQNRWKAQTIGSILGFYLFLCRESRWYGWGCFTGSPQAENRRLLAASLYINYVWKNGWLVARLTCCRSARFFSSFSFSIDIPTNVNFGSITIHFGGKIGWYILLQSAFPRCIPLTDFVEERLKGHPWQGMARSTHWFAIYKSGITLTPNQCSVHKRQEMIPRLWLYIR